MSVVTVREMQAEDEYFVSTCSHEQESDEIDACGRRRLTWLREEQAHGGHALTALIDDHHVGFLYLLPIERCPWGPLGKGLAVIPCLWVTQDAHGKKVGRAMMEHAEHVARDAGYKGVVIAAYYKDHWFMPASFFEHMGYTAAVREGRHALMWKTFDPTAEPPQFLKSKYAYQEIPGKVTVDLFWNQLCETSDIEAQRVREVAAEFGDTVVLREWPAHDRPTLLCHQTPRGIYVNGDEIGWGYEASRDGIRKAIQDALRSMTP